LHSSDTVDFEKLVPQSSSVIRRTLRVETPLITISMSAKMSVSGQFKMDINGHEKSPQHGRVKEEKSSPTRIGLVTATNTDSRGEQT